jgi:hypothetical protein
VPRECVSITLIIHHAMSIRRVIIVIFGLSGPTIFFHVIS